MSLRKGFNSTLVSDGEFADTVDELLSEQVDLVVMTPEGCFQTGMIRSLLDAGRHILLDPDCSENCQQELRRSLEFLQDTELFLGVWQPDLLEADFASARSVAESQDSGPVRAARIMQHSFSPSLEDNGELLSQTRRRLRQAFSLFPLGVSEAQVSVRHDESLRFEQSRDRETKIATSATVALSFESGATASIDIDLAGAVPVDTGWILQKSRGGYQNGRQFLIEPDSEVYDVSAEATIVDPYEHLLRALREPLEARTKAANKSLELELEVSRVLAQLQV